ncbi:5'-3' exonuclease [Naumannella sp. ID2617S]|nr:5'-3' exonuclease [Naumannella sp. ID2617S]
MLLDTASLYFRAFHGLPDSIRTPDGRPVNAVRGLLDFIARLVTDHSPSHLAACWDNDWRPQWRVDLLASYKTHRVAEPAPLAERAERAEPSVIGAGGVGADSGVAEESPDGLSHQVPWIVDTLTALGVAIVGADGFEADDVIASLAAQTEVPCDVVTGDRDLFQLVDDAQGVRILYTARGMSNLQLVDNAWVQQKYGISGRHYADFAALRGDTSDGIPGVPGIGEKTAAGLVNAFGDLESMIEAALDPDSAMTGTQRKRFDQAADYLAVAGEVVRVRRDLDLGVRLPDLQLPTRPADPERFAELTERLALGSSAERVLAALGR